MNKGLVWNVLFLFAGALAPAQQIIHLKNPSFELDKKNKCGEEPLYWDNLGDEFETAPDVQPGCFNVTTYALHGTLYLGLVVRDNGTGESVGQALNGQLEKDSTYLFTLSLARAPVLTSMSRTTGREASYNKACSLQIYAVHTDDKRTELIGETYPVAHTDWKDYTFEFRPTLGSYNYLQLKAVFSPESDGFYNGNILIDNLSAITQKTP
ncbi:MAG: hypothetical protein SFV52_14420 [Saprospiraceae bacterium]|nr:hypothetical protein [Saprospiraceae bacterium]